jgi:outer membrane protein OmpA-like peptidoglycan-associated protein
MGAADLFMTRKENGTWSEPIPLPAPVNSEANELFPFIDDRNRLFFSSNRENGDMDIYCAVLEEDGSWRAPFKLEEPVNSPYDDFGFICRDHGQEGYYSSNRVDSIDNLFSFRSGHPAFTNCKPIKENSFCYLIEEEKIMDIDSLPLRYVWDLGDGNKAEGLKIKHCFTELGTYDVSLSIVDTITGLIYADVSELQIQIDMPDRAYFSIPDTVHANELISLQADDQYLSAFDEDEWFWSMGDGNDERGEDLEYSYKAPGKYRLELGGLTLPDNQGDRSETCVYKDIIVVEKERRIANFEDPRFRTKNLKAAIEGKRLANNDNAENSTYFVELLRSEDRVPFNSPLFLGIEEAITERFIPDDKVYTYNVGEGKSMSQVYDVFKSLSNSGFENMRVKGEKVATVFKQTTKIGTFIAKDDTTALNNEFKKLQDIKFEYDSHEILKESYDNLDYIVAMLKVEPSYKVSIKAHTDNVGGYRYNIKLSDKRAESVVDYFEAKGIQRDQMVWKGYGDTEPVASNNSEEGRALNRRVEFEIIEMDNTAEK